MNLLALWLGLATIASLAVLWRSWRLPPFPGRRAFAVLLLAVAWWTGAAGLEHAAGRPELKIFWSEMAWLGIIGAPSCWALFIWNYTRGKYRPIPHLLYWLPLLVALGVLLLALTNSSHHLIYSDIVPVGSGPDLDLKYFHGPIFYIIAIVFYFIMLFSEFVVFYSAQYSADIYRRHYFYFAISSTIPWAINISYVTGVYTLTVFDPTPFSFVIMNIIFYLIVSRAQLFDIVPIAHRTLLDAIPDAVLVLDRDLRIAECNPAARNLVDGHALVGLALSAVPELHRALGPLLGSTDVDRRKEAVIGPQMTTFEVGQVPLKYADGVVGQLLLLRDVSHRKETERRLQAALTELETQLKSNILLQKQLREQSIRDTLTGLHNRRFLDEWGPALLVEAKRSGGPLAAVMVDIDNFKRVNDTYGHLAGDAILREMGVFLRRNIRQSDAVFRMGGEEFLILLPHTTGSQAFNRVETWRKDFMAQTLLYDDTPLNATFSAGIALFPQDADTMQELLRQADMALYHAKLDGRNRSFLWQADIDDAQPPGSGEESTSIKTT
ncbi:histidine kinase N-terminal 7TM domain-containing protein [Telmatospirillum sp.]|uniref:histidine kinase N-terminal 7TM domain-containing diguanylate cyclase n=1 Tax=Telmatospirillum sp. TaxID=2079197 RepID=UPI00283CFB1F|nr:histidine kinase N-terminal 7TM domain-containing protein [Telmatospirillum sp.]MDR3437915.1 diguanylate cyclase [Telmatospirillum sp.]